jgi:phage shock protein A
MGIFSRLGDIINSNLNSMLDQAEDPEKIARLIIAEMEDTLIEVRSNAARSIADKKEAERKIARLEAQAEDWDAKAGLALEKDREDLARGALSQKQRLIEMADLARRELAAAEDAIAKANEDMVKLQAKLDEAKAKHKALMMRARAAEDRVKVRSQLSSSKISDAMARYEMMERKVDDLEARAEAYDLGKGGKSLEQEFAELRASDSVEAELAALKAKMGKA